MDSRLWIATLVSLACDDGKRVSSARDDRGWACGLDLLESAFAKADSKACAVWITKEAAALACLWSLWIATPLLPQRLAMTEMPKFQKWILVDLA